MTERQDEAWKIFDDPAITYFLARGGARSGKTHVLCRYTATRALIFPNTAHLIARYIRARARQTIWQQTLLPMAKELQALGLARIIEASENLSIRFKNGSYILVEGLDPSRIQGVLGSQYATIFLNECNEISWSVVELMTSRLNATARNAAGEMIQRKMLADCNPTVKSSWDYNFFVRKLNPGDKSPRNDPEKITSFWFHPSHNTANQAPGYIATLESGSPDFRKRFLEGEYGSFEGLVYRLNHEVHIVDPWRPDPNRRKVSMVLGRAIDFGFWPDPFVCLWIAHDLIRQTLTIYREWHMHKLTVRAHAHQIYRMSQEDVGLTNAVPADEDEFYQQMKQGRFAKIQNAYGWTVCDHDRSDREDLAVAGIENENADKRRQTGIDHIMDLMDFNTRKKPRLFVTRDCTNTILELESYRWREVKEGRDNKRAKDKDDRETAGPDHCMDSLRYGAMKAIPPAYGDMKFVLGKLT